MLFRLLDTKYLFLFLLFFVGCGEGSVYKSSENTPTTQIDYIKERGTLTAVTDFNSTNYFIYKGEPMGFQFDMLQAFAQYLGVKLELIAENNLDEAFGMLKQKQVDIFANNLTVTTARKEQFLFTVPISTTRQVLVQSKESDGYPIRNPIELGNRVVYVQKGSAAAERLYNLSNEIGREIFVVEMPQYEVDELIELVAVGELDLTVCDEDVARVNSFYYENLDIETAVSFDQNLAWAVHKESVNLHKELNRWIESFTETAEYRIIKGKYFNNPFWARRVLSENARTKVGNVSLYDHGFKAASSTIEWDWRLFASMVYQESRFKPDAESHMGAYGLMQFMPETALFFGIMHKTEDPITQINAGARYLKWLEKRFDSVEDPEQKIKFMLAAYNAGLGHIIDARNLARKYGKDPDVWDDNVDFFVLNKSNPDYLNDTTVKYGNLKGIETYNYVSQIMQRYKHYQNILPH